MAMVSCGGTLAMAAPSYGGHESLVTAVLWNSEYVHSTVKATLHSVAWWPRGYGARLTINRSAHFTVLYHSTYIR